MALYHLSGDEDEVGKTKKKKGGKGKKKKVAKVGLAPARAAFLTVVTLNLLRTGTKLARVWNKDGGKPRLQNWWTKLGGNPDKLKKAISKGSKQTISGDEMGIAPEAVIALAVPLMIAVAPLIKEFKSQGDASEAGEFDNGIEKGKKDLADDPDIEKSTALMPEGADVAKIKKGGKEKEGEGEGEKTGLSLATNPLSICFLILLFIMTLQLTNPILSLIASIFALYSVIGFLVIPFSEFGFAGQRVKNISRKYFDVPATWFNSITKFFSHGKK